MVVEKDDESYKIETYIVVVWLRLMMSGNWKRKNGNPTFELASEKEKIVSVSEGKGLWSESRRLGNGAIAPATLREFYGKCWFILCKFEL